jgi:hypothetical protein
MIFELYKDRILWTHDGETVKIILGCPIIFPANNVFNFFSNKAEKLEDVIIPDVILPLLFVDKNTIYNPKENDNQMRQTFKIIKRSNFISVIFTFSKRDDITLNFTDQSQTMVVNGYLHKYLKHPVTQTQNGSIFKLPLNKIICSFPYYHIEYNPRHQKVILTDKCGHFHFDKKSFPKMFPL